MKAKILVLSVVLFLLLSGIVAAIGDDISGGEIVRSDHEPFDETLYPFDDEYPSVQQLNDWYDDIVEENPDIARKIHIGESWEGRDIWVIKVSDNVEEEQDEPSIFIHGNIHAREWSSHQAAAYFLWRLVEDYGQNDTITWLVDNRQIYVAPMVNPDGYIYDGNGELDEDGEGRGWRKNRNSSTPTSDVGVDLNRNWDIQWESGDDDPSSGAYRGESPFSEYETKNLRDFILDKEIDSYQDLHSYYGVLMIPWAHTSDPSPHDEWYRDAADDMTSKTSLLGRDDRRYGYGQPAETIGYSAPGGSIDWVYNETGAISLCYEIYTGGLWMGPGFYPDEEYIMPINLDIYDSLVYQARIADTDLGHGDHNLHPPSPYIVYGNVEEDGPVVDTKVTIENLDTGETMNTDTDPNGYYEFNLGNFVEEGYDSDDPFAISVEERDVVFDIDDRWGRRLDIDGEGVYRLTIEEPVGEGTVEVHGEEITEWPYVRDHYQDTEVDLEAVPGSGWYFERWSGEHEAEDEETVVTMDDNVVVGAVFEKYVSLTIEDISGYGIVTVDGETVMETPFDKDYERGEESVLSVEADDGWYFDGWDGMDAEDGDITLIMNEEVRITSVPFEKYVTLTIENITGEGKVFIDGEEITDTPFVRRYKQGEEAELSASSQEDWYLEDWEGIPEDEDNITKSMDEDVTITNVLFGEEEKSMEVMIETVVTLVIILVVLGYMMNVRKERDKAEVENNEKSDLPVMQKKSGSGDTESGSKE